MTQQGPHKYPVALDFWVENKQTVETGNLEMKPFIE